MAVTGSLSSEPGYISLSPSLCTEVAFSSSVVKEKPNWLIASTMTSVPPERSITALMICTQVVATMPPKVT